MQLVNIPIQQFPYFHGSSTYPLKTGPGGNKAPSRMMWAVALGGTIAGTWDPRSFNWRFQILKWRCKPGIFFMQNVWLIDWNISLLHRSSPKDGFLNQIRTHLETQSFSKNKKGGGESKHWEKDKNDKSGLSPQSHLGGVNCPAEQEVPNHSLASTFSLTDRRREHSASAVSQFAHELWFSLSTNRQVDSNSTFLFCRHFCGEGNWR